MRLDPTNDGLEVAIINSARRQNLSPYEVSAELFNAATEQARKNETCVESLIRRLDLQ